MTRQIKSCVSEHMADWKGGEVGVCEEEGLTYGGN